MSTENKQLMTEARASLDGKWGIAIGATVIYMIVACSGSAIPFLGPIISLVITGPLMVGVSSFYLTISKKQEPDIQLIFSGFKKFNTSFCAYLLQFLFVFLWTLLLIIPGIIAALSYAFTFYIIAEEESIGALEALAKSKKMMKGNKFKLFCLGWRFFGWGLLCILTCGIGLLWLWPYSMTSFAHFYNDIKQSNVASIENSEPTPAAE